MHLSSAAVLENNANASITKVQKKKMNHNAFHLTPVMWSLILKIKLTQSVAKALNATLILKLYISEYF